MIYMTSRIVAALLAVVLWLSVVPAEAQHKPSSGLPPVGSEGDCLLTTSGVWAPGLCPGGGSGAPTTSQYWTGAADATLSAEKNLGVLGTGLVINTAGVPSIYAGATCTNQVVRILGASGGATCATITSAFVDTSIWTGTVSSGLLKASSQGVLAQAVSGTDYVVPSGNVATATALAANGSNCPVGMAPLGVNAFGAVETCTDYQEEPVSNGMVTKTGANTSAARTITGTANEIAVTNGDGVGGNPTLALPSTVNLSSKTLRLPGSITLPATCTAQDVYVDTDATSGQRMYLCESANTWVLQGDGGAGGGIGGTVGTTDLAVPKASGTGGSTLQASGCTISAGNQMTCPGGFVAGTSGVGKITMLEGTAPGAGTNAGEHNLYFDSTDSTLKSHENGGSVVTYARIAAEGSGLTIPRRIWLPAAGCNNATAGSVWDLPTTSPAVATCVTGTNTQKGVLEFADAANLSAQITHKLPSTWTGTVDANIKWATTATTGSVVWQMQTSCVADAETDDPAFNTASTVTDAAKGTTLQTNDAAITGVTVTGCAAGELLHLKILRDSAHASDTMAATARLIGVELVIREAL